MKKRSLWMLLLTVIGLTGIFTSCKSDENVDKINTLEVTPSSTIQFKASGNSPVTLNVKTDASSWSVTAPEWIDAKQEGATLTLSAKDNTTDGSRSGRIEITAGTAQAVTISVTQDKRAPEDPDALSVDPTDDITFKASGNEPVVLTVTTNAESWAYEVPEWILATKEGDKLSLSAQANPTTSTRSGRIEITAGTAQAVYINVLQQAGDGTVEEGVKGMLKNTSEGELSTTITTMDALKKTLRFELAEAAGKDVQVEIVADEAYVAEYNFIHSTNYVAYPVSEVSVEGGSVTIQAGQTASNDITVTVKTDNREALRNNVEYMLPLTVRAKTDNVSLSGDDVRVNYLFSRQCKKEVKNILFFEVNSTNPLNALEYRLKDGSMFFDAVVLFSANIRWNAMSDEVYLHNNPNVQALLDGSEVYLQPLRKAGIKVLLGLLGDHTPAGVANLTDYGAKMYANDVANAIKQYQLDGVALDDEYTEGSGSSACFAGNSSTAASRLAYELKKAMKEKCDWDTYVCAYQYGTFSQSLPAYQGQNPGSFIDIAVADYPVGAAFTYYGMDKSGCAAQSIELNLNRGNVSAAYGAKEKGYGWFMWFAFDPSPTSNIENKEGSVSAFKEAADGLYGMDLVEPTGYYKKVTPGGDVGGYDPTRYEF